jgi:hypothetical protein
LYEHITVHGDLCDHAFERREVDLPQRSLVDLGRDPCPVGLLVVRREVLDRGADTLGLETLHQRGCEDARHQWVLGEVLEVAPAQR